MAAAHIAVVSGDKGFIGRHIKAALHDTGYFVAGFDARTGMDAVSWFREHTDEAPQVDIFVHAAAVTGSGDFPLAAAANFAIDSECIQWAMRTRPRKLVLFSSADAYPIALQGARTYRQLVESDIDIEHLRTPDGMNGLAKIALEAQAARLREYGVDVIVVRPFEVWGLDQDINDPLPSMIHRIMNRADELVIASDGTAVRDYVHIDDVCAAVLAMIRQGIAGPVNLCSGIGVSLGAAAEMLCDLAGYRPVISHDMNVDTGVHYQVGDPTMMANFYSPQLSIRQHLEHLMR